MNEYNDQDYYNKQYEWWLDRINSGNEVCFGNPEQQAQQLAKIDTDVKSGQASYENVGVDYDGRIL